MTGSGSRAARSVRSVPRRGCLLVGANRPGQLAAIGDAELAEDLAQVVFDGAGADEQPGGDLPVGQVPGDQPGDLLLLRGEHLRGSGAARAGPFPGGAQLAAGAGGERRHAHRVEHREGGAQLVPGIAAAALPTQPLTVHQVRAGNLGTPPTAAEPADRLVVVRFGGVSLAEQRAGARLDSQPVLGSSGPCRFRQPVEGIADDARVSGACGGLDQLGQRPHGDIYELVLASISGRIQCLLVTAQTVVEDCGHPVRECHRESLASGCGLLDGGLDQRDGLRFLALERGQNHGGDGRETGTGRVGYCTGFSDQRSGSREVATPYDLYSYIVQKDRELVERAHVTDDLNLPDAHAPALVVVPESSVCYCINPGPPE